MKNKIILFAFVFLFAIQTTNLFAEDALPGGNPPVEVPLVVEPATEIPAYPLSPIDEEEEEVSDIDETKIKDPEIVSKSEEVAEPQSASEPTMTMASFSAESESATTTRLIIKKNSQIIFDQTIEIIDEPINFKASGEDKTISRNTALGVMLYADSLSDDFAFTNIDYYSSWDSYYINCLNIPAIQESDLCVDWQYVVNNSYPGKGADKFKEFENKNIMYLYFGKSEKLTFPTNVQLNEEFAVVAESYDYVNDTWDKMVNRVIGVIKMNGLSHVEIATSTTDTNGEVKFSLGQDDSYVVGFYNESIYGDYYDPTYNLVFGTTTVSVATGTATSTDGGSSGGSGSSAKTFDVEKAFSFLVKNQKTNGSFGEDLYTDWVAVAFGANKESNASLKELIKTDSVSSDLMEYLRRSMALMSLGVNPQTGFKNDLMQKILSEYTDEQFGDSDLYNDDIFAVLVLSNFGFQYEDERIKNSINFIIESQSGDGSWGGVDLTAAAAQALKNYSGNDKVDSSIEKAKNYLKSSKRNDGSWNDNVYTTAWAMLGVTSFGEDYGSFGNSGDPLEYFGKEQAEDGGLLAGESDDNRIWATAYAIAAASGKDWNDILKDFKYVVPKDEEKANGDSSDSPAITNSTSTVETASSTAIVDENLEIKPVLLGQKMLGQNSDIELSVSADVSNDETATNTDQLDEDQQKNALQANAINSTTDFNYWYLAGGVLFALIALLIFRK